MHIYLLEAGRTVDYPVCGHSRLVHSYCRRLDSLRYGSVSVDTTYGTHKLTPLGTPC